MHIFIRHGNDEKKGDYLQDHSLNDEQKYKDDIINHTHDLIKTYGVPDIVYCSPFHRARQTIHIMEKILSSDVKIYVNPKLSRFFSKKEKLNPSVKRKTLKYHPPIDESGKEFKQRVDQIIKNYKSPKIIWYVTHYLVIKRIAKTHNQQIPQAMPFLYTMVI
jgi:broad specificity phosphatase PhoE